MGPTDTPLVATATITRTIDATLPWAYENAGLARQPDSNNPHGSASQGGITVPLETQQRITACLGFRFADARAEADYQRFVSSRRLGLMTGFGAALFAAELGVLATVLPSDDVTFRALQHTIPRFLATLITFVVSLVAFRYWERRRALLESESAEVRYACERRRNEVGRRLSLGMLLLITLAYLLSATLMEPGKCENITAVEADPVVICEEMLSITHIAGAVFAFALVHDPLRLLGTGAFAVSSLVAMELALLGTGAAKWLIARCIGLILMYSIVVAVAAGRDRRARAHYAAMALTHAARLEVDATRRGALAVLQALLPAAVVRRVGRVDTTLGPSAASAAVAAVIADEAENAAVLVTAAADLRGFERHFQTRPHMVLAGLAHLFALFDIGAQVFGVDRGMTSGDAYVATAGLVRGSGSTVAGLVRYALWQHALDESSVLPLRSGLATGRLAARASGTAGTLRYEVRGEALGAALRLRAVAAETGQELCACGRTAALLRALRHGSNDLHVSPAPTGQGEATGVFTVRLLPRTDEDGVTSPSDAPPETVTPMTEVLSSVGGGSHYSPDVDELSRRMLIEADLRAVAVSAQRGRGELDVSGTDESATDALALPHLAAWPDTATETDCRGHPAAKANGAIAVNVVVTETEPEQGVFAAPVKRNGFFADAAHEAPFRASVAPRPWIALPLVFLSVPAIIRIDAYVENDPTASASDALIAVSLASITLALGAAGLALFTHPPVSNARHALNTALVVGSVALIGVSHYLSGPHITRNSGLTVACIENVIMSLEALVALPWPATLCISFASTFGFLVPVSASMSAAGLQFACLLVSFAMCYDNGVASREHFAATLAATQDAAALAAVTAELEAMAAGLMPAQATAEAVRQAVDEARRLAQGIERDAEMAAEHQAAVTRSASHGGAMAEALALFNDERLDGRIARLADVLRGNYAAERVHCIDWAVVGHFEFAGDDCDDRSAAIDRALAAATAMHTRLMRCVEVADGADGDAEFDDLLSVQRPVAVMRDARVEPPEQPRAETVANPLEEAADEDADGDASKRRRLPPSMAFGARPTHSGRLEAADVEAGRIRLVRSVGGTVAVAGPLDEDASPQAVAVAAVCAAAFAAELSRAAAEAGLTVAGALVAEECAGALLGQGAMRYGVHGVATTHAAAVASAAETLLRPSPAAPAASSATVCTSHFVHELADGVQLAQVAETRAAAEAVCPASGAARVRWYLRDAGPVDGVAVVSHTPAPVPA